MDISRESQGDLSSSDRGTRKINNIVCIAHNKKVWSFCFLFQYKWASCIWTSLFMSVSKLFLLLFLPHSCYFTLTHSDTVRDDLRHKEMEQQHSPRVASSHLLTGKCMKIVLFDALIHRDTWRSCVHTVKMRMWSNTVTCRLGVALCTALNAKCRITKTGSTVSYIRLCPSLSTWHSVLYISVLAL